jgi:hypothetical protein
MQSIVLSFEQKESFIVLTKRFPLLYFKSTLKRLLSDILFIIQDRNSHCLETKQYTVKVFLYNASLLTCISYITGQCHDPFVFSTRAEFLCVGAHLNRLFFLHPFYFSFKKQTNPNYNFFFTTSRLFL